MWNVDLEKAFDFIANGQRKLSNIIINSTYTLAFSKCFT